MTAPGSPLASTAHRALDVLVTVGFVGALLVPFGDLFVRDDEARGPGPEYRLPAPEPVSPRTLREFLEFPDRYGAYWNDSFGLRDRLLRWHSIVKIFGFGVSPDATHVIGEDRWIYIDAFDSIDSWRGAIPLQPAELEAWRLRIERHRDAAHALGAKYLFSIAPDKPQIYPERLPKRFNKVGPSRMGQLFAYMRERSNVDVLDLRPALLAEKQNDRPGDYTYYELGAHWKLRGAIAGYNAFAEHLRPKFPTLKSLPLSMHEDSEKGGLGDSEALRMYIPDLLTQRERWLSLRAPPQHRVVAQFAAPRRRFSEIDDPTLPRIVIFQDSFGFHMEGQWSETASRLATIQSDDFDVGIIERERPDLVIECFVERSLVIEDPMNDDRLDEVTDANRYYASTDVIAKLDVTRPQRMIQSLFRGRVASGIDAAGPYVELTTVGKPDAFAILGIPSLNHRDLIVRAELEFARPAVVSLVWKCANHEEWSEDRAIERNLVSGRNEVFFPLRIGEPSLSGLVLNPLAMGGRCRLRALEIRACDRDEGRGKSQ